MFSWIRECFSAPLDAATAAALTTASKDQAKQAKAKWDKEEAELFRWKLPFLFRWKISKLIRKAVKEGKTSITLHLTRTFWLHKQAGDIWVDFDYGMARQEVADYVEARGFHVEPREIGTEDDLEYYLKISWD